ncbi:VIT1/CCC1 transporter family protein [Marinobacterium iners]|uniref:Predicted Fe2+/Mn2+ transporter, VIT1/CCC1 family n=1 Tax=Marinobacterium iners DSM 11526 TaxID=1122198 RepID=A0A1H4CZ49_9GAMM|nr:VIT family protein [Marinobacterium iners]SEA65677.1 Predicted Fe2+/Mn2+ transporter, VIT1/CCC1 family [Marinobacterium iners DSM 11526]
MSHVEIHRSHRVGWLRAAVLGANDGIVSTASLIIGVAAANTSHESIILAGVAGLVAGAMSMAAGEYISVSSQSDTEQADLALEQKSLDTDLEFETQELADIYQNRGVEQALARQVAEQLMAHDALDAHARDEIGISANGGAQPVQVALSSAVTFTVGAALPLLVAWMVPTGYLITLVALCSLVFLAMLGAIAAKAGGASLVIGAIRVVFWGGLAMALTAGVGKMFGVVA